MKDKILLSYMKMVKEIIMFGDIEIDNQNFTAIKIQFF